MREVNVEERLKNVKQTMNEVKTNKDKVNNDEHAHYDGSKLYYEKYYNPNPWTWEDGKPRRHNFTTEEIHDCYTSCTSTLDGNLKLSPEKCTPGYAYDSNRKEWYYCNGFYLSKEKSFNPEGKFYSVPEFPVRPTLKEFKRMIEKNLNVGINKISSEELNDNKVIKKLLEDVYNAKVKRYETLLFYLSEMLDMTSGLVRHMEEEKNARYQKLVEEKKRREAERTPDSTVTNIFGGLLNRLEKEDDYFVESHPYRIPESPYSRMPERRLYETSYVPNSRMSYEDQFRQGLRDAANGRIPLDDPFEYYNERRSYRPYNSTSFANSRERFFRSILKSQGKTTEEINAKLHPKTSRRVPTYDAYDDDDEEFKPSIAKVTIDGVTKEYVVGGKVHVPRYMYDYDINYRRSIAPRVKDLPVLRTPSELEAMKRTERFRNMSASEFFEKFYEYAEAVEIGERRKRNTTRMVNSYDHKNYKECMVGMSNKFPYSVNSGLEHLEIAMRTDQVAKLLERERIIREYDLENPKVIANMGTEKITLKQSWIPYLTREIPFNHNKWTLADREAYSVQKMLYEKGMNNSDIEKLINEGEFIVTPEMKVEGFIRQHYSVDYFTKEESEKIINSAEYKDYINNLAKETGMSAERIIDNSNKRRKFYENILKQHPYLKEKTYDKIYGKDL